MNARLAPTRGLKVCRYRGAAATSSSRIGILVSKPVQRITRSNSTLPAVGEDHTRPFESIDCRREGALAPSDRAHELVGLGPELLHEHAAGIRQQPLHQLPGLDVERNIRRTPGREQRQQFPAQAKKKLQAFVDDGHRQEHHAIQGPLPVVYGISCLTDPVRSGVGKARRQVVPGLAQPDTRLDRHASTQREDGFGRVRRDSSHDVGA